MSYSCEMIKDLLPLYQDEVCSEESRRAVEEHLAGCPQCAEYARQLAQGRAFGAGQAPSEADRHMAESLKKVHKKLDRRKKKMLAGALAAVALVAAAYPLLFVIPLKAVDFKDVSVTAEVYPFAELEKHLAEGEVEVQVFGDQQDQSVTISKGEWDDSETYTVVIPALSDQQINISGNVMEENEALTVVNWSSPYFLREIRYDQSKPQDGDTLYISAFKTTLLNNRAQQYNTTLCGMEFRALQRIVFVQPDGSQQLLWQAK